MTLIRATEKMIFGHAVMTGHLSEKITQEDFASKMVSHIKKPNLESLGFFGMDTPSMSQFYPDLTVEDLTPKDSDFIYPVVRALSEVMVRPYWPVDFSMDNTLKASLKKLKGQTIYLNHEAIVGNEVGSVVEVYWQPAYTTSDGIKVPAGINAKLKVDAKTRPNIARAILMDPPSIHSVSVTVEFSWKKSHDDMDDDTFYNNLGKQINKQLVRRVVSEIHNYHEISFVSHGADAYAQVLNENKEIVNPKYAKSVYKFSNGDEKQFANAHFFDYKTGLSLETFSGNEDDQVITILNRSINNENLPTTMKLSAKLVSMLTLFQIAQEGLTEETALEKLAELITPLKTASDTLTAQVTALQGDKTANEAKIASLEAEKVSLTAKAAAGDAALLDMRGRALKLYNVLEEGKTEAGTIKLINESEYAVVKVLLSNYETQMAAKFPTAPVQSSKPAPIAEPEKAEDKLTKLEKPLTNAEVLASLGDFGAEENANFFKNL